MLLLSGCGEEVDGVILFKLTFSSDYADAVHRIAMIVVETKKGDVRGEADWSGTYATKWKINLESEFAYVSIREEEVMAGFQGYTYHTAAKVKEVKHGGEIKSPKATVKFGQVIKVPVTFK